MVRTPLLAFLAASNELPEPEGNLGAVWSRMTIRVVVNPLDRAGKQSLAKARLNQNSRGKTVSIQLTLADVEVLRSARPFVQVSQDIVDTVLDILQELVDEKTADFPWAWSDDRRFARMLDILQAKALLEGRVAVGKQDLAVLEW